MDSFDRVFVLNHKFLSWAGLGINQKYRERLIRNYVMGFMLLYAVFGQLCQLLTMDGDLASVVPIIQNFISAVCLSVLYYAAMVHYMTLMTLNSHMKQDWQRLKNGVELEIMQKHAYISKLFTLSIGLLFYLYAFIFVSLSVLRIILSTNEVRKDIDHYPIISCFDYFLDRRTYYYPVVIYQVMTCAVVPTVATAIYTMYFTIIQHICARLSVIRYEINHPFINEDHNDELSETPLDLSKWVIDIVRRLARTTELMTLLNTAFEKVYLVQMFLAFLFLILDFLCLFEIPVLLKRKEGREYVLSFLCVIVSSIFPIYINCYIGQRLIDYSVAVYKETCLVSIHNLSLKTQKLLLTTLMISSKPFAISIGKIYVSSHEFFSNIIRSSLSFAMVLRSVQRI